MVEIKTFVEVANNVNKVREGEGEGRGRGGGGGGGGGGGCTYPITYKHGVLLDFCLAI